MAIIHASGVLLLTAHTDCSHICHMAWREEKVTIIPITKSGGLTPAYYLGRRGQGGRRRRRARPRRSHIRRRRYPPRPAVSWGVVLGLSLLGFQHFQRAFSHSPFLDRSGLFEPFTLPTSKVLHRMRTDRPLRSRLVLPFLSAQL